MRHGMLAAWLVGLLAATPLSAQQPTPTGPPDSPPCPAPVAISASQVHATVPDVVGPAEAEPWQTAWGLVGLRGIPAGVRTAPNGLEYHPNFSLDVSLNGWIWRGHGLYGFADMRLWGEKGEYGVTNSRDGWLGTSKREFDLSGGVAWNYTGPWELRAFGYTGNNLNRGDNPVTPAGFTDGFGLENRYYLSPEYAKLGQTGFDVTRATFVSIGYLPSKELVGNDGQTFRPGMTLRAYLTYGLWDWPAYVFGDATYISDQSFQPRLLLLDVGVAARPIRPCRQWEFRTGVESTADFHVRNAQSLWYVSVRYIF
jgi:hypothetical protein